MIAEGRSPNKARGQHSMCIVKASNLLSNVYVLMEGSSASANCREPRAAASLTRAGEMQ
jgi:hypothetical protein